ncbi:amidase domain-containing protein [Cohnella sp.]|uniref:amidase domain-containing protein n=1 Tax=Cohnella sp. TaxID=1883426 RepID=UPI0035693A8B
MRSVETDWKQALFGYVSTINEAALHADALKLRDIPHKEHRERMAKRLQCSAQRETKWAIRPIRSEMRARIERYNVIRGEVIADVSIHLVRSMEQCNQPWIEERVEREKIRLGRVGKSWRIMDVKPLAIEQQREALPLREHVQDEWNGERKQALPSIPYMNPLAIYGFKSKVYAGSTSLDNEYGYGAGRGVPYRREAAVAYAERWWNEPNPAYENFEVNCTNYVSQCLFAGGAPMNYTGRRESGWWYKGYSNSQEMWSFSWAVANSLQQLLSRQRAFGLRAEPVSMPESLQLGDVICYDWDGSGRVGHNAIVTAFTPEGMPLVNANTVSSRHRYWDYKDSYALTDQTRYYFYHITDDF